jgi:hypothetical protein
MNGLSPIAGSLPTKAINPPQCLQAAGSPLSGSGGIGSNLLRLWRLKLAREPAPNISRRHRIDAFTFDASKLGTAGLYNHRAHGLVTLRARWIGHGCARTGSRAGAQHSLSPVEAMAGRRSRNYAPFMSAKRLNSKRTKCSGLEWSQNTAPARGKR